MSPTRPIPPMSPGPNLLLRGGHILYRLEVGATGAGAFRVRGEDGDHLLRPSGGRNETPTPHQDRRLLGALQDGLGPVDAERWWEFDLRSGCLSEDDLARWMEHTPGAADLWGRGFVVRGYAVPPQCPIFRGYTHALVGPSAIATEHRVSEESWEAFAVRHRPHAGWRPPGATLDVSITSPVTGRRGGRSR